MSWQEVMADEIVIARKELERSARRAWADLVRDMMPWDVVINAATFATRTPDDPEGTTMHSLNQGSDLVFSVCCDRLHYQGWSAPFLAPGGTIDQVDRRTPHRSA